MWGFVISPANWNRCKICEWDGALTQCIHSLKIAINIYRCIKQSAGMMLTMKNIVIATWTCLHRFDLHIIISWPEYVRRVNIVVILYIVMFGGILYYLILAVDDSLGLLVTLMSLQNMKRNYLNCFVFGLSNFNIIPLLPIMLNFVGQHHTSWLFYTSITVQTCSCGNDNVFHETYIIEFHYQF
jgi:hypothetical protein